MLLRNVLYNATLCKSFKLLFHLHTSTYLLPNRNNKLRISFFKICSLIWPSDKGLFGREIMFLKLESKCVF